LVFFRRELLWGMQFNVERMYSGGLLDVSASVRAVYCERRQSAKSPREEDSRVAEAHKDQRRPPVYSSSRQKLNDSSSAAARQHKTKVSHLRDMHPAKLICDATDSGSRRWIALCIHTGRRLGIFLAILISRTGLDRGDTSYGDCLGYLGRELLWLLLLQEWLLLVI
jgi:hypothetical protein